MNHSQNKKPTLLEILSRSKDIIVEALPDHLKAERMIRVMRTEVSKNPKLNDHKIAMSVMGAMVQAAQLGLEIGSGMEQAYLIPFKDTCKLIIGYKGMIEIAYRSGKVSSISNHLVFKNDKFKFWVTQDGEFMNFEPDFKVDNGKPTPENTLVVFAQATLSSGVVKTHPVRIWEIEQVRADSLSKCREDYQIASSPWTTNWGAMALKTAIRRIYKTLPKSVEMMQVERIEDNDGEITRNIALDVLPDRIIDIIPESRTIDEDEFDRHEAKLVDSLSLAEQLLTPEKYAEVKDRVKFDTLKDLKNGIDDLNTVLADAKK